MKSRARLAVLGALALVASLFAVPITASANEVASKAGPEGTSLVLSGDAVQVSESGSYIVVLEEAPVLASESQDNLGSARAKSKAKKLKEGQDEVLAEAGLKASDKVNSYTNALNGFSAVLSYKDAQKLAGNSKVALVLADELLQPTTNSSPDYLGLTVKGGAYDSGLTGEGVIVGVIDSGIWPEHPSFADDGSYPDLGITLPDYAFSTACEFGNSAHNSADVAFTCNNKLLGARQAIPTYRALIGASAFEFDSARDDDGHGTHTASTAAGNAGVPADMYGVDLGEVSGIAPRARIIAYKGLGALGGFSSDLALAIDTAVSDGVDVINYSIGSSSPAIGADDIAFLFASLSGVMVATSAGNNGPGDSTIGSPAPVPWLTTVGASTQKRFYEGTVKGGPTVKGASLTPGTEGKLPFTDAEFAGGDLCLPGTLDPGAVAGTIVLCRRGATGRASKSLAVSNAGGLGMVLYNNSDTDNLFTDTHVIPSVHIDFTDGIKLKEYIAKEMSKGKTPTAEIKDTGKVKNWKPNPSMTIFSSRGPNGLTADIIKPDVTAPGLQILAGASPYANAVGDDFQAIAGTSMSSPHVAGLFALLTQAHPDWSPAAAKSALMTTADTKVKDNDRKSDATPFAMGAGHVDPGKVSKNGSAFNPGVVYEVGASFGDPFFDYAAYTCGADLGVFIGCGSLADFDPSDLNLASIGIAELAGTQTVVRTVTSVADSNTKWKAKVKAPAGFTATVSPSEFTLAPGESATFEVTFTNVNSPAGEWRFGELELKGGGGYKAVSPIALNAAAFDAPAEVAGVGTDGSASFDVTFGYTGDYTAAAHGLVPSTVLSDAIGQDPDQTYPSGDDADPGVITHSIVLSDAALLRIALNIPGPDDIDLFLLDSGNNIIAASTNGATDELIELSLPADGIYTLVVHGWSIPNAPLPYEIDTWAVPLTPGTGPLMIDSAPASATLGTTGTIDVSWSGLAGGTHYLGAVSHTGPDGLLGLTLVDVMS